ncbi:class I ribonucleotide reductase maintenance protein YfaE [Yersinia ruckeri]|uniref:class I ribonucleotide reductase maintenance protein YfaE n=1 Tax=Yersinia ruckeri TaxID=29486 RepID=UPI001F47F7F4|nr:class I ribonucleotide reductase maintenance protein YfaE [Yersinia ruckeri]UIM99776.1 2Fe-2S ferredoxin-like protein [Yersinia ruckeri]
MATKAIINLRTSGTQVPYSDNGSSLLEALEHYQIAVEYQCRSGYCGSCRTRLLRGEVCYQQQPLAFIQDGDILPCCCTPVGDIELEM